MCSSRLTESLEESSLTTGFVERLLWKCSRISHLPFCSVVVGNCLVEGTSNFRLSLTDLAL